MSKHGKRCNEDCCHQMECCPKGVIEKIQNCFYLRDVTDITFVGYWWHELKSLIGLNTTLCFDCYMDECKEHTEPPLTLSQRCVKKLKRLIGGIS